jgi:hypothetical protein
MPTLTPSPRPTPLPSSKPSSTPSQHSSPKPIVSVINSDTLPTPSPISQSIPGLSFWPTTDDLPASIQSVPPLTSSTTTTSSLSQGESLSISDPSDASLYPVPIPPSISPTALPIGLPWNFSSPDIIADPTSGQPTASTAVDEGCSTDDTATVSYS